MRNHEKKTEPLNGRSALFALAALIVCFCVGIHYFSGWEAVWKTWRIPVMSPCFADLRVLTSGAESHELGLDPFVDNPCDPWNRPVNYPRIWRGVFALDIDQSHTPLFGGVLIIVFLSGVFLFLDKIDEQTALFLFAVIFSPAVMLGMERANTDIIIFFMMSAAIAAANRSSTASFSLLAIAFALKLFPVFGIGLFLNKGKKGFLLIGSSAAFLCAVYLFFAFEDIIRIAAATPGGNIHAFGVRPLEMLLERFFSPHFPWLFSRGVAILLGAAAVLSASMGARQLPESSHTNAFRAGAGVFLGVFLLGGNWEYRFMFLIFAVPQLSLWLREKTRAGMAARLSAACLILSCWDFAFSHAMGNRLWLYFDEVFNWTLFASLAFLYAASMPDWLLLRGLRVRS